MKDVLLAILAPAVCVLGLMLWGEHTRPAKTKVVVKTERQVIVKRVRTKPTIRTCLDVMTPKSSKVNKLRWWERREIVAVAITLTKKDNLQQFHALLNRQVKFMEPCPTVGEKECFQRIAIMRMSINRFLKRMMKADRKELEIEWGEGYLHYVASLTVYNDNLSKLRTFIGKQVVALRECLVPSWRVPNNDPECAEQLSKSALRIDAYFKKMVTDHGGPLVDRNWNKG